MSTKLQVENVRPEALTCNSRLNKAKHSRKWNATVSISDLISAYHSLQHERHVTKGCITIFSLNPLFKRLWLARTDLKGILITSITYDYQYAVVSWGLAVVRCKIKTTRTHPRPGLQANAVRPASSHASIRIHQIFRLLKYHAIRPTPAPRVELRDRPPLPPPRLYRDLLGTNTQ